jgi:KDO2-lipid IV(A) lauroyltransferase
LFSLIRKRRHITLTNLRLCLPHLSEAERARIARQHFQMYARSVLERGILWWASERRLKRLIQVEPAVPLDVIQQGPTILMCPHFVCLDVAGVAVMLESSLCSIYTEQRNKVFDLALRRGRSRFRPVKLFSRADGVKPIIRAMHEGLPYFMLPDMDFGKKCRVRAFLRCTCRNADGIATPCCIDRCKSGAGDRDHAARLPRMESHFHAPWENYPGEDMIAATRQMNASLNRKS